MVLIGSSSYSLRQPRNITGDYILRIMPRRMMISSLVELSSCRHRQFVGSRASRYKALRSVCDLSCASACRLERGFGVDGDALLTLLTVHCGRILMRGRDSGKMVVARKSIATDLFRWISQVFWSASCLIAAEHEDSEGSQSLFRPWRFSRPSRINFPKSRRQRAANFYYALIWSYRVDVQRPMRHLLTKSFNCCMLKLE